MMVSCSKQDAVQNSVYQTILGRDGGSNSGAIIRRPVYRAFIPEFWIRKDPSTDESIADTMRPLVEFFIPTSEGEVRLTVYNFPYESLDERIPPAAQIARWRQQSSLEEPLSARETRCAHDGFSGIYLEGPELLAWAMQLCPEHFRSLQRPGSLEQRQFLSQLRADYTIKATGSVEAIQRAKNSIELFSNSFQLIQEIPTPL